MLQDLKEHTEHATIMSRSTGEAQESNYDSFLINPIIRTVWLTHLIDFKKPVTEQADN